MKFKLTISILVIILLASSCKKNKYQIAFENYSKGISFYNDGCDKMKNKDTAGSITYFNQALPYFVNASNADTGYYYYRKMVAECLFYTHRYRSASIVYEKIFEKRLEYNLSSEEDRESYRKWACSENNVGHYQVANEMNKRIYKAEDEINNSYKSTSSSDDYSKCSSSSYSNDYHTNRSSYESETHRSTYKSSSSEPTSSYHSTRGRYR
jgi:tetratricopeptide (TPR) repeat protein